jgi:hypothetical protein
MRPRAKLAAPSMMKSHCQPASPLLQKLGSRCIYNVRVKPRGLPSSKPANIPAASSPENAVVSTRPEYS